MNKQQSYAIFRFYGELNEFLCPQYRKVEFQHNYKGRVSVKDFIESLGVPHTEIDLILVNGESVDFTYHLRHKDQVSVYPRFQSIDIMALSKVQAQPLENISFVNDIHLGKLAKYLRMLGFDTLYENNLSDTELALLSSNEHRVLLTRDCGLLKRRIVEYGHFVRQVEPVKQLQEVVQYFDLKSVIKPFYRCIRCNGLLISVDKCEIEKHLLPMTKQYYDEFKKCENCKYIYWKGSHYQNMHGLISSIMGEKLKCN